MLFQTNGLMPELPVPHYEHPSAPQMKDTSVVDAYLKMHQIIFTKEQERRHTKANEALQRWPQTFAINECKRQEEFKTQQMQYAEEADERGTEQSLTFLADQQQRAKEFLTGESQRGNTFAEKDRRRSQQFSTFLRQWKADLERVQERALADAHAGETKRAKELARWMVTVHGEFLNLMAAWKDAFGNDEWKREQRFNEHNRVN